MSKFEQLDMLLQQNNGYLRTADAVAAGISKSMLAVYVKENAMERVAHGLYMSNDTWVDDMYVLQVRYPKAIFSHETALFLLKAAEREPIRFALTFEAGANGKALSDQGVRVHKVKKELFALGLISIYSPAGHALRSYDMERTICDLVRSRTAIETQVLQEAIKGYARRKDKNIPRLMRYAKAFSIEKIIRQYMEVLL